MDDGRLACASARSLSSARHLLTTREQSEKAAPEVRDNKRFSPSLECRRPPGRLAPMRVLGANKGEIKKEAREKIEVNMNDKSNRSIVGGGGGGGARDATARRVCLSVCIASTRANAFYYCIFSPAAGQSREERDNIACALMKCARARSRAGEKDSSGERCSI